MHIDRRSTSTPDGAAKETPLAERHADGRVRRVPSAPGTRSAYDYFDPSRNDRQVTRGELINVLGAFEFGRRDNRWWRRLLWPLFTKLGLVKRPLVRDLSRSAGDAHFAALMDMKRGLEAELARREAQENAAGAGSCGRC